ncbi:ribokinase [Loktanella sp. IMCC34160]|uniref:PfkB family carbohydrate kinase n=1 Tax=Loktanella sp. IMCC34160 TaxID=2510646 RepID=UPI00101CED86|nr:PfkB family carbohydrate kinase [Loktanella sp. IMCC34160]RYG89150.1 ribokinase [Loktanella sp. IMCC34160]
MTILNIGSINRDRVFRVAHFPLPGETLVASAVQVGLGGKGLNHSVAIHRSGGRVRHLGAIGHGDTDMRARISDLGISEDAIVEVEGAETGSALILVDVAGENQIVIDPGANRCIPSHVIEKEIGALRPSADWIFLQNETNGLSEAITLAKAAQIRVALAAAPFEADVVLPLLGDLDLLAVNAIEYAQLCAAIGGADKLPEGLRMFISHGAQGAEFRSPEITCSAPALPVTPVDTTGAGDTAFGAFLARLDLGERPELALRFSMAAGAIQVTRSGAATAIPFEREVKRLLATLSA